MGVQNRDGALFFASGIDNSGLKRDAEEAKRYLQNIADFATQTGAAIGVGFSTVAIKGFMDKIIDVRGEMQMLETSFDVLLGGKGVKAFMGELKQFAVDSPLSLSGVSQAAQTLLGFNVEAEKVVDTIKQIGDISRGNEQRFSSLTLAFAQMSATGKLMGQDLNQMINAGFNPLQEISARTGKSISELKKEMENGSVSADMVAEAFKSATAEGGKFYGMTQKQAEGIRVLQAQLEGAREDAFNNMGQQTEGVISDMYKMGISVAENYDKIGKILISLIATYGVYKAAIVMATIASKGYTASQMLQYNWLLLVERAQKILNATMLKNPYVLVATAVAGLIAVLWSLHDSTTAEERAQAKLNDTMKKTSEVKENLKSKSAQLKTIIDSETSSIREQIEAYNELIGLVPELKGKPISEIKSMKPEDIAKISSQRAEKESDAIVFGDYDKAKERVKSLNSEIERLQNLQKNADADTAASLSTSISMTKNQLKEAELSVNNYAHKIVELNDVKRQAAEESKRVDKEAEKQDKEYWKKQLDTAQAALDKLTKDNTAAEWSDARKKVSDAQKQVDRYSVNKNADTSASQQANALNEANERLSEIRKKNSKEEIRLADDLANEVAQAEINSMDEGFSRKVKQAELNHKIELQAIERQKQDYIEKIIQAKKDEFDAQEEIKSKQNKNYVKKSFDGSSVSVDTSSFDSLTNESKNKYKNEQKQAWNDLASEYGNYYQKRLAIADKWEREIAGLPAEFQAEARSKMNSELSNLDAEYSKTANAITTLFKDSSEKSVSELRKIADEAERMKDFVIGGQWDSSRGDDFGITEAQFKALNDEWDKSPEKIEAIKKAIREMRMEADRSENGFQKISNNLKKMFDSGTGTKDRKKAFEDLADGIGEVNSLAQSVGNNISSIFSAFGNDDGAELAGNITNLVGGVAEAGTGIAQLASGDIIGGIKSLANGITNVVTSITRMGDAKHEKKIQQLQNQIETLNKSYEALGDAIGNAYSKDASALIEQQNVLLKQQQLLLKQQIKEEEAKKKTDKNKIKEWQNAYDEIDKQIAENKVKAVDAIFGEDIQSAIDNFAQAYVDMWAAGDDKAASRKDFVKSMIKNMILEAMKTDIAKPMEAIRAKLEQFWSDDFISDYENNIIDGMLANLQNELDKKYSWADKYIKNGSSSSSSGVTGELKAQMTEGTASQLVGLWNMTAMDIRGIREFFEKNGTPNIEKSINDLLNELYAIRQNTRETADNTSYLEEGIRKLEEKLEEIKKNTKPNNSRI